jgi:DNA topoisomerase-1
MARRGKKKSSAALKLLIVESPSKCAKIESYLGTEYQCIASCGHFREIADGLGGINHRFEPTFTLMKDKKDIVAQMLKVAKSFHRNNIILATDDDREGEAIAWHICQVLSLPVETTPRIVFHEITQSALEHAVQHPRPIQMSVVKAQHARQVLDLMVGYRISPFLWRVFFHSKSKPLSAGRCQTPTLRLVYDNSQLDRQLVLKYKTKGYTPIFPLELNHEFDTPDQVRDFLRQSQTFSHTMTLLPSKETVHHPPQPLTTSRLLQVASNVLHSSPKHTMQVCQTLYQQGLITYMRTDSATYAAPFLHTVASYIQTTFGSDEYVNPNLPTTLGEAAAAHEAIRVTDLSITTLDDAKTSAMYKMIWRHTVESCMAPARFNVFPVRVSAPNESEYRASIEIPIFWGWKRLQQQSKDDPHTLLLQARLYDNKPIPMQYIQSQPVAHNKHVHFTEAGLVKKLEEMGIGRPSTYASLVETIQDRGYVKKMNVEGQTHSITEFIWRNTETTTIEETHKTLIFGQESNKLVIQPTGKACVEFLMQYFGDLFAYDYTQRMELQLDEIARSTDPTADGYIMCKQCSDDIDRLSQPVTDLGKMTYPLADSSDYVVVFQPHGISIRRTDPMDQTVSYMPVSADDLDMERIKRGEYSTSDLLGSSSPPRQSSLGKIDGYDVFLKNGRYGKYLEWNGQKCSAKLAPNHPHSLTLEEAEMMLKHRAPPPAATTGMLRTINSDCSVREGKYGPYVFYKTSEMKSPMFFAVKQFNWQTASDSEVLHWVRDQSIRR